MTRRSVKFGDVNFQLIIYRCGFQYRLRGYNLLTNEIYEGNVFQQEVQQLCDDFNRKITGTSIADERKKISPWSYHKVTEMLISNMGIAEVMPSVSTNLGGMPGTAKMSYILVMRPYATQDTPGISKIKNLRRVLKDTCQVVEKLNKMIARQQKMKSQGLTPSYPIMLPERKKLSLKELKEKDQKRAEAAAEKAAENAKSRDEMFKTRGAKFPSI